MIEELLPGNRTKMRILKSIYESEGINLTTLIRATKASPNFVLRYVNALIAHGILQEYRIRGRERTHMRIVRPDLSTELGKAAFQVVEMERKSLLLDKYPFLKPGADQLEELCARYTLVAVLYGSYARLAAAKESDLDLLFLGKMDKSILWKVKEIFVTLDIEVSIKTVTITRFLKEKNKPLYQNILQEHIVLGGGWRFMEIAQQAKG